MSLLKDNKQKLLERDALLTLVQQWKKEGKRIVFTNGCFDLLHPGHVDYLAKASSLGDKLIVALNTDASVQRLKGPSRPIQNQEARAFILSNFSFISALTFFGEETPIDLITSIQPDILVKGADYNLDGVVGANEVIFHGGSVVLLPYLEGYSTSAMEKKIKGS